MSKKHRLLKVVANNLKIGDQVTIENNTEGVRENGDTIIIPKGSYGKIISFSSMKNEVEVYFPYYKSYIKGDRDLFINI